MPWHAFYIVHLFKADAKFTKRWDGSSVASGMNSNSPIRALPSGGVPSSKQLSKPPGAACLCVKRSGASQRRIVGFAAVLLPKVPKAEPANFIIAVGSNTHCTWTMVPIKDPERKSRSYTFNKSIKRGPSKNPTQSKSTASRRCSSCRAGLALPSTQSYSAIKSHHRMCCTSIPMYRGTKRGNRGNRRELGTSADPFPEAQGL
jgi:hypothetical protein